MSRSILHGALPGSAYRDFLIFSKKCVDKLRLVCYYSYAVYKTYGGIAQLARAFGSYPECPRFKSRCRYQTKAQRTIYTAPFIWPVGQEVKTPPFHGGNMGSSPVRVTKKKTPIERWVFFFLLIVVRDSKGEVVNGVPGALQSRAPARPQAGSPVRKK